MGDRDTTLAGMTGHDDDGLRPAPLMGVQVNGHVWRESEEPLDTDAFWSVFAPAVEERGWLFGGVLTDTDLNAPDDPQRPDESGYAVQGDEWLRFAVVGRLRRDNGRPLSPVDVTGIVVDALRRTGYRFEVREYRATRTQPPRWGGLDGVVAPFTAEQVDSLNGYQASGMGHPFTCPRRGDGEHTRPVTRVDGVVVPGDVLVAATFGWMCPTCGYPQDWAHQFMADGSWRLTLLAQRRP